MLPSPISHILSHIVFEAIAILFWFPVDEDFSVAPLSVTNINDVTTVVSVLDDDLVESKETIILRPFTSPRARLLFDPDQIVNITIIDNDGK